MSSQDIAVRLVLTGDGKLAVDAADSTGKALERLGDAGEEASHHLDDIGGRILTLNQALELAQRVSSGTVEPVIELSESYVQLKSRVELATKEFGDSNAAFADVLKIARDTGQPLDAIGDLYVKTAGAANTLGLSQQQVAESVSAVSKAMVIDSVNTQTAQGMLLQFSQAMASGVLRGEEFNSVAEASPTLLNNMANGLGVTRGELKEMANSGELSARAVVLALGAQASAFDSAYAQMPDTVERATNKVRTALAEYLGSANESHGVTTTLAHAISGLADHMDVLGSAAGVIAVGGLAKLLQTGYESLAYLVSDTRERFENIAAIRAQEAAKAELAKTEAAATAEAVAAAVAETNAKRTAAAANLAAVRDAELAAAARIEQAEVEIAFADQQNIRGARRIAIEAELAAAYKARAGAATQVAVAETVLAEAEAAAVTAATVAVDASVASTGKLVASAGMLRGALGLLGGPVGVILAAVSAFSLFEFWQNKSKDSTDALTKSIGNQRDKLADLGKSGTQLYIQEQQRALEAILSEKEVLERDIEKLDGRISRNQHRIDSDSSGDLQTLEFRQRQATELAQQRLELASRLEVAQKRIAEQTRNVSNAQEHLNSLTHDGNIAGHDQLGQYAYIGAQLVKATELYKDYYEAVRGGAEADLAKKDAVEKVAKAIGNQLQQQDAALAVSISQSRVSEVEAEEQQTRLGLAERVLQNLKDEENAVLRLGEVRRAELTNELRAAEAVAEQKRAAAVLSSNLGQSARDAAAVEVKTAEERVRVINEQITVAGTLSSVQRKTLTDAYATATQLRNEVEQRKAAANAARVEAVALGVVTNARNRDLVVVGQYTKESAVTAKELDGLAAAATQARDEVDDLSKQQAAGTATSQQVFDAVGRAAGAHQAYAEAVQRTVEQLDSGMDAQNRQNDLSVLSTEILVARAEVARDYYRAMGEETKATRLDNDIKSLGVEVTNQKIKALLDEADALKQKAGLVQRMALLDGNYSVAEQAQVNSINDAAAAKEKEAKQTRAVADAKQVEAAASAIAQKARERDLVSVNGYQQQLAVTEKELATLALSAARAGAVVEELTKRQKEGTATIQQVVVAQGAAAGAQRSYAEAVRRAVDESDGSVEAQNRRNELTIRSTELEIAHQKAIRDIADARGDENRSAQADIEIKRLSVVSAEQEAKALADAADALEQRAAILKEELLLDGQLDTKEQAQIQAILDAAEARRIDSQAVQEHVRVLREEYQATLNNTRAQEEASKHFFENLHREAAEQSQKLGSVLDATLQSLQKLSPAAVDAFNSITGLASPAANEAEKLSRQLQSVNTELKATEKAAAANNEVGIPEWLIGIQLASEKVTAEFYRQAMAAEQLRTKLASMKEISDDEASSITQTVGSLKLLDGSTLDNIKGEVDRLKQATDTLKQSIDDAVRSARTELLQELGDQTSLENDRYQQRVEEIKKLQSELSAGSSEQQVKLMQALQDLEYSHRIRMQKIEDEKIKAQEQQRVEEQRRLEEQKNEQQCAEEQRKLGEQESVPVMVNKTTGTSRVATFQASNSPNNYDLSELGVGDAHSVLKQFERIDLSRLNQQFLELQKLLSGLGSAMNNMPPLRTNDNVVELLLRHKKSSLFLGQS